MDDAAAAEAPDKPSRVPKDFKPTVFLFYAPDEPEATPDTEAAEEAAETADDLPEAAAAAVPVKWLLTADVTQATLVAFLESHKAGELKPHLKSEEPPASQDGAVVAVVGKTFDDVVMDPTKDVLLEVYAPWCQHCQSLAPIWEKLARRFQPVDSVVIAKIDGTANEHPLIADVGGFPAIFFFPAEAGKKRVTFGEDEGRTLPAFTKWLKANARVPYELKKKAGAAAAADADAKDEL